MMPLTIVLIHGLSQQNEDPLEVFDRIKQEIQQILPQPNIKYFTWKDLVVNAPKQLARGQLLKNLLPEFRSFLNEIDLNTNIVVIAYSAGGFLFYRWLADSQTTQAVIDRIAFAFMIGAPHQCPEGFVTLERDKRKLNVGERSLTKPEVEKILEFAGDKLKIYWGDNDDTIKPSNAQFPPYQMKDLSAVSSVDNVLVLGATHLSICAEDKVVSDLRSYLTAYMSRLP